MKQKILKTITALMLIATLTMANFLFLGVSMISYAAEQISVSKATNHKNVEFMAYLKNENGDKIESKDVLMNQNDLRLYFQISVKKEGYFNGDITFNHANFQLKTDKLSDSINTIENNKITLNQINAGETKEIEVAIDVLKDDNFDLDLINMEAQITINGIYRDSTEKDISIKSDREIQLNLIVSKELASDKSVLSQEIITNKVINYNGEDKRVIQVEISSGISESLYPIKQSSLIINAPKISDKYPEEVLINSIDELATNGKEISKDNWNYEQEAGIININIENKAQDNKVSWVKNNLDKFIVTYIFDKDVELKEQKLSATSKIEFYDVNNTKIERGNEISLINEEKDSIIRTNINYVENEIYKGKLYFGISKDIAYTNSININLNDIADEINIIEQKQTINTENDNEEINAIYKSTKINKQDLENVLGENGKLIIINADNNQVISSIDNNTEADESGYIAINYPDNVQSINIRIVSPKNIGKIDVETIKTVNNIDESLVRKALSINSKITGNYVLNNNENEISEVEGKIGLKETQTSASLTINKSELSAMSTNKNVEFRIVLNSNSEDNELFKNPTLRLELPNKFENIQINSVDLLYEDEMDIKTATLNGNIVEIILEGEQTQYKERAVDGAIIIINADLTTSKKIASSTEQVKLTYTNKNVINYIDDANVGIDVKDINIISYAGVVTTNEISEYGIDVVNNEGIKNAKLSVSADTKNVKIEKKIINNKENKIANVKILGSFPTKNAIDSNNIDMEINGQLAVSGIDSSRAKIYYSQNSNATEELEDINNAWKEEIENPKEVKKYLVLINELDILEEVDLSYEITIPANLEYNESAEEGYNVYYEDVKTSVVESVKLSNLRLSTGQGATVETSLKALVGGEEVNDVKTGEVVRYLVTLSNIGSEDVNNVKAVASIPEGTTYVAVGKIENEGEQDTDNYDPYIEDKSKNSIEFVFESLKQGETRTEYYEVKVNEDTDVNTISNKVVTTYGEVSKESNEIVNTVKMADLRMSICAVDDNGVVQSGYGYRYTINIRNTSNKNLKNVKVDVINSDVFEIKSLMYIDENGQYVVEKENKYVVIENIPTNGYVDISVETLINQFHDMDKKDINISATATIDNEKYHSNQLNIIAQSASLSFDISSENRGNYVKAGDIIEYKVKVTNNGSNRVNNIQIENVISNYTSLKTIKKNSEEIKEEEFTITNSTLAGGKVVDIESSLEAGESVEYAIQVVVNAIPGNTQAIEISNMTIVTVDSIKFEEETIKHIIEPEETVDVDGEDNGNDGESSGGSSNNDTGDNDYVEGSVKTKVISGTAWLDENSNGQKDSDEKLLSGIKVELLNTENNKIAKDAKGNDITATTNDEGFYSLNSIPEGEYLVIFNYDTSKYILTNYQKDGVSSQNSSKVISRVIDIDNEQRAVASTEVIKIDDNNVGNINIGLQEAKIFDFKLEKFVSKVVVQNSKETETNTYNDATLAKAEIHAKLVNSTTVVVEYTIKITNEGEVDGYARKVVDYLSTDYKFSSDLNKDWYQSGNEVYNSSLANEKIAPGESKEIKLIVTKQMNESNTGLITNTAEIVESYNENGLKDIDSTSANKAKSEDDMGSADLILGIKTGEIMTTVLLVISTILILGAGTFMIARLVLRRRIM